MSKVEHGSEKIANFARNAGGGAGKSGNNWIRTSDPLLVRQVL